VSETGTVVAYQSLYRKYRPQKFSELVGQEHVTNALRNAVRDERVGHAYLFSGPRGTGKTTTARILAKALNCTNLGADGEPCGECETCVGIAEGSSLDVMEVDAASKSRVEEMRDLIDRVAYSAGGTRKVYILDEVHMLSANAEAALLKTLEEAPAHVVFILATTDPQKVAPTIRSRTQHFEFTLLTSEQLEARLADLLAREAVEFDPEAVAVIARAGAGSARDAESLLDQALAHATGRLTADAVAELFGGTPTEARAKILDAIAAEDAADALVALSELLDSGHEPRRVAEDLLSMARDAFLVNAGGGRVHIDAPAEEQEGLVRLGEALGNAALVRVIETIGQAVVDMRGTDAADPRLVLEVALVRLSRRDAGPPLQTVVERIERLERAIAGGAGSAAPAAPAASASTAPADNDDGETAPRRPRPKATIGGVRAAKSAAAEPAAPTDDAPADAAPAGEAAPPEAPPDAAPETATAPSTSPAPDGDEPVDLDDVILAWAALLPSLPVATRSAVQSAQPLRVEGDVVVFGVSPTLLGQARERFRREADTVRAELANHLGRRVKFNLVATEEFGLTGESRSGERAPRASADRTTTSDSAPPSSAAPPATHESDEIDLRDVIDAPPEDGSPSVNLLREHLGATVVEEVPRD
jgi:DNA polymerase-3 subunit gamma/tau